MVLSTSEAEFRHPLADGVPPSWASGWGEDTWGPFVELTFAEASQRFRWIPPGRFLMGSPDDEPGREADEGPQHWVTISEGFWLFDTACTQALWESVMGENPSRFVDPLRPVEQVNWEDCQRFAECVGAEHGLSLTLPTEAEWEYACRAGTTTATYAGPIEIVGENSAPILDGIAWYGGNSGVGYDLEEAADSSDWPEKQYSFDKCGTRKVATRDPNGWGLYDMLGNVWEWCRDGHRDYSDEPVSDPLGSDEASAVRCLRGGSWFNYARNVRAAVRLAGHPDFRNYYFGFRCRVQ